VYRLAFLSDVDPSVSLDGDRLAPAALAQAADRGILLRRGAHPVTVRVGTGRVNPAYVRWEWIPPLPEGRANDHDEWTIVPPQVLRPVEPVRRVGGTA